MTPAAQAFETKKIALQAIADGRAVWLIDQWPGPVFTSDQAKQEFTDWLAAIIIAANQDGWLAAWTQAVAQTREADARIVDAMMGARRIDIAAAIRAAQEPPP